jgi:cytochrome c553
MKTTDCRLMPIVVLACAFVPATSAESPKFLLDFYANEAKASDPGLSGFSAARGEHLFRTNFSTGKPDTPSCTTCHTTDATKTGQTRAGKDIEPMAASANPKRYGD